MRMGRKIIQFLVFSLKMSAFAVAAGILAYSLPLFHKAYLRKVVGTRVVLVTNKDPRKTESYGGGTGFHVKAASGKTYIVTNRHVCGETGEKRDYMYVSAKDDSVVHKVKIIERYPESDLCLLEPIEGIEGLEVGSMPVIGQHIAAIGHPNLQPRTLTDGEVVGMESWTIAIGIVGYDMKAADCRYKDTFIKTVPINPFTKAPVCFSKNFIMITTALIWHGSSGSPVVDFFGKVVGVMYAVNNDGMWGRAITVADLNALLSKY